MNKHTNKSGADLVDEKVLWFEIAMKNVVTVTEFKTSQQLVHERLHTTTTRPLNSWYMNDYTRPPQHSVTELKTSQQLVHERLNTTTTRPLDSWYMNDYARPPQHSVTELKTSQQLVHE